MNAARQGPTSTCMGEVGREAAGRGSKRRFSRIEKMTKRARHLRANLTDAEQKLWRALTCNQIDGLSFRRQHPVGHSRSISIVQRFTSRSKSMADDTRKKPASARIDAAWIG
jgi:Protein of unknown function (DUF559)